MMSDPNEPRPIESYVCPIDGSSMTRANLGDGYESDFGAVCGKCHFEYSKRDSGSLDEQARKYVQGVVTEYKSIPGLEREAVRELREKESVLEQKIKVLRGCAQGEFLSEVGPVIFRG